MMKYAEFKHGGAAAVCEVQEKLHVAALLRAHLFEFAIRHLLRYGPNVSVVSIHLHDVRCCLGRVVQRAH